MQALLNLAEECLRVIPLLGQAALSGVGFWSNCLQKRQICESEITSSLVARGSALIGALLEKLLGYPSRLLWARNRTVLLRIDRRVGEYQRCGCGCEQCGCRVAEGRAQRIAQPARRVHR